MRILERIVVFCLLSVLMLGLTVDSVSAKIGINAFFLPALLMSKTLPEASLDKLASGRDMEAIDIARLAIVKQPLSVEALSVLSRSSAVLNPEMSSESLVQAATLGWRDVAVQAAVIETATLAQNWAAVGPRLVALTRLDRLDAIERGGFLSADAQDYTSQVTHAFSDDGSSWLKFAMWLRTTGQNKDSEYFLGSAPSFNREDECFQLGQIANDFARENEIQFAAQLVSTRCQNFLTSASGEVSIDQNFGNNRRGPFEWKVTDQPGIIYNIKSKDGKSILEVVNSDPFSRLIASKVFAGKDVIVRDIMYSSSINSGKMEVRSLDLSFSCIDGGGAAPNSGLRFKLKDVDRCDFVRVKFRLPTGRFQLWVN